MQDSEIRKIIHSYVIVFRSLLLDEHIKHPNYDLVYTLDTDAGFFNSVVNINLKEEDVESELNQIEKYYKKRNKNILIAIEPSTKPSNIEEIIQKKGYMYSSEYNCKFWLKSVLNFEKNFNKEVYFQIAFDQKTFHDYLKVANEGWSDVIEYSNFASSFSKLYNKNPDGVMNYHIVGYIDLEPVCSATLGIYMNYAHLINISVKKEYRRKGIASQMIKKASDICSGLMINNIYVCIDENDEPATSVLKRLEFRDIILERMYKKDYENK